MPSQSHRCFLQRRRTRRAGPGRPQAAGLRAQNEFQLGLGLGASAPTRGAPGGPGESEGHARGRGGRGVHYYPLPRPRRFQGTALRPPRPPIATPGSGRGVWLSKRIRRRPRMARSRTASPATGAAGMGHEGAPRGSPWVFALTLHCQEDAP